MTRRAARTITSITAGWWPSERCPMALIQPGGSKNFRLAPGKCEPGHISPGQTPTISAVDGQPVADTRPWKTLAYGRS
jgi:hypothetical protein